MTSLIIDGDGHIRTFPFEKPQLVLNKLRKQCDACDAQRVGDFPFAEKSLGSSDRARARWYRERA